MPAGSFTALSTVRTAARLPWQWPILLSGRCLPFTNAREGPAGSLGLPECHAESQNYCGSCTLESSQAFLIIPL